MKISGLQGQRSIELGIRRDMSSRMDLKKQSGDADVQSNVPEFKKILEECEAAAGGPVKKDSE